MLVTLEAINSQEKTSKAGKPYTSLGIKTTEHGDKWINGFGNASTKAWNKGDKVELEINEDPKWGMQFKVPNATDTLKKENNALSDRVVKLEKQVVYLHNSMKESGILGDSQALPPISKEKEGFNEAFREAIQDGDVPF